MSLFTLTIIYLASARNIKRKLENFLPFKSEFPQSKYEQEELFFFVPHPLPTLVAARPLQFTSGIHASFDITPGLICGYVVIITRTVCPVFVHRLGIARSIEIIDTGYHAAASLP